MAADSDKDVILAGISVAAESQGGEKGLCF
jgi:hypothetical protein